MRSLVRGLLRFVLLAAAGAGLIIQACPDAAAQTAPTSGPPIGIACAYNSSVPTLASGTAGWVQCGSDGGLKLSGSSSISNPSTSAVTSVASSTSPTVILAANTNRLRYSIFNDSTAVMYVLENSGTVSTSNYSYQIAAGQYYTTTSWRGAVNALWATANGNARVTEYTP